MKQLILILSAIALTTSVAWGSRSLEQKQEDYVNIFKRQEALHKSYQDIYKRLTDINDRESLQTWFRAYTQDPSNILKYNAVARDIQYDIQGDDYRRLLFYYTMTGQSEQGAKTVGFYLLSGHTLLDNIGMDPQAQHLLPNSVFSSIASLPGLSLSRIKEIEACYKAKMERNGHKRVIDDKVVKEGFFSNGYYSVTQGVRSCVRGSSYAHKINGYLADVYRTHDYPGAPYPVSFSGYTSDNDVELLNHIPMSPKHILNLGAQLNVALETVSSLGKKYSEMTVDEYKVLMVTPQDALNSMFTESEGFQNIHDQKSLTAVGFLEQTADEIKEEGYATIGHPTFGPHRQGNAQLGTFGKMIQSIRDAEESVFIDLFWMGGSIGMNLAKELMKKVIENPEFTVIIITDNENKFQYGVQLDMIYNYMRAFAEKFPELNFYITPTQISKKRTALPEFVDLLITDNVVNNLYGNESIKSVLANDGFNLLAKSDHTKVMVMDGKPRIVDGEVVSGVAYVGSKNWTDASGGANYDEVAAVKGPATAVILDAFYYDAYEAFLLDTHKSLGGEMVKAHKAAKFSKLNTRKAIEKMLEPMDVVNRHGNQSFSVPYAAVGYADYTVAPAQNNIYGTEMSPVDQDIQAILSAKHQIIIDDQFLYDPSVVEALKVAKKEHNVEIYVMLESLLPYEEGASKVGAHIPNNLFIPEMVELGIEVKWQTTPPDVLEAARKTSTDPASGRQIGATFHVKSLSTDGVLLSDYENGACNKGESAVVGNGSHPMVISGSANKDVMTMSGGFRESQIATYSPAATVTHDCLFWQRWHDENFSVYTDGLDFEMPEQAGKAGITDKRVFLNVLRQIIFAPYNFTKDFF